MKANKVQNESEVNDGNQCQSTCEIESILHVFVGEGLLDPIVVCSRDPIMTVSVMLQYPFELTRWLCDM